MREPPLLRDLLADDGSLWLHCDHRHAHHLRCLLEEVFGVKNYLNTITWRSQTPRGEGQRLYFANSAHAIHVFAKDRSAPTCWMLAEKDVDPERGTGRKGVYARRVVLSVPPTPAPSCSRACSGSTPKAGSCT